MEALSVFWVLNAAALGAYFALKEPTEVDRFLVICFGFMSSLCWLLINIGSKWWQEAWEARLQESESYLKAGFFSKYNVSENKRLFDLPLVHISVTGVVTAFSLYLLIVWFVLGISLLLDVTSEYLIAPYLGTPEKLSVMAFFTLIYSVCTFTVNARKDDFDANESERGDSRELI